MKNITYSLIVIILMSVFPAQLSANTVTQHSEQASVSIGEASKGKIKKRKLKKTVRKAGRVYRKLKSDNESRKKSRQVQRKVRSIINIF